MAVEVLRQASASKGARLALRSLLKLFGTFCAVLVLLLSQSERARATSVCEGAEGNLVLNCGFESGIVNSAPADWSVNNGFEIFEGSLNRVRANVEYSGAYALQFGNLDYQPAAGISQTMSDIVGANYIVSFFLLDGGASEQDPNAFFDAQINGTTLFSVTGLTAPAAYTQFSFSFTGTGSDTLSFLADTNPSEFYLDDIVVTDPAVSSDTPEPATYVLLFAGLAGLGLFAASRSRLECVLLRSPRGTRR